MRLTCSVFLFSIVAMGPMSPLWAQTNEEAFEQFQWQVSTPGARTNAMGRAFMTSAGDATAAVINPAGLINLSRPHVLADFRSTDLRVERFATVDSLFTGALTMFSDTINALSFVGFAMPLRGNRVALALTRHEFLDYQSSTSRRIERPCSSVRACSPTMTIARGLWGTCSRERTSRRPRHNASMCTSDPCSTSGAMPPPPAGLSAEASALGDMPRRTSPTFGSKSSWSHWAYIFERSPVLRRQTRAETLGASPRAPASPSHV